MRTKAEIDHDYSNVALQLGHKYRIIADLKVEIDQDTQKLQELSKEAQALPKEEVKALEKTAS